MWVKCHNPQISQPGFSPTEREREKERERKREREREREKPLDCSRIKSVCCSKTNATFLSIENSTDAPTEGPSYTVFFHLKVISYDVSIKQ